MIVLPNMGLVKWDSINDYFSHVQLAANMEALDSHNHTAGKGVQIPYGGLAEQSVGPENLREAVFDQSFHDVMSATGSVGSKVSGTRYFPKTGGATEATAVAANISWQYLVVGDYNTTGKTTKYRVRATAASGSVEPATSITVGLYKVSSISAGTFTLGAVTSGSTVVLGPLPNEIFKNLSSEFTLVEGAYVLAAALGGTTAEASNTAVYCKLQYHHV